MARPKSTTPTVAVCVQLPRDLAQKVELYLFSEVESRVPHGAKSAFFAQLVREHFRAQLGHEPAEGPANA